MKYRQIKKLWKSYSQPTFVKNQLVLYKKHLSEIKIFEKNFVVYLGGGKIKFLKRGMKRMKLLSHPLLDDFLKQNFLFKDKGVKYE